MTVGDYPQQITKDVTFLVVNYSFAYNEILERPTLNSWKTVTSTYHLMIKFPTEYGIGQLRGDQVAACKCYIAMLELGDYQQTMYIGEQRTAAEPVEELKEIILDESKTGTEDQNGHFGQPADTSRPNRFPKDELGCVRVESRKNARDRPVSYSPQTEC